MCIYEYRARQKQNNPKRKAYTAEELEAIAAAVKENNRDYQYDYQRGLGVNPSEEYRARQKRNNEKQKPTTKAAQKLAVKNKLYHCTPCNVACRENASLVLHNTTKRHMKQLLIVAVVRSWLSLHVDRYAACLSPIHSV
jgi:hypothetical protein